MFHWSPLRHSSTQIRTDCQRARPCFLVVFLNNLLFFVHFLFRLNQSFHTQPVLPPYPWPALYTCVLDSTDDIYLNSILKSVGSLDLHSNAEPCLDWYSMELFGNRGFIGAFTYTSAARGSVFSFLFYSANAFRARRFESCRPWKWYLRLYIHGLLQAKIRGTYSAGVKHIHTYVCGCYRFYKSIKTHRSDWAVTISASFDRWVATRTTVVKL